MQNGHEHFGHVNEVLAHADGELAVRAQGVEYSFGSGEAKTKVLHDNNFEIGRGEIVIMTGPSGSGKTTLLTLIGMLRTMQQGTLEVMGHDVARLHPDQQVEMRKRIGFIFQHHNLFGSLTALENVRLATSLRPGKAKVKRQQCAEILERLGLADRMHYLPSRLSGGQRQRVAIARALVNEPTLVLADEPTAALEAHSTGVVMGLLRDLTKGPQKTTVLIVTHDQRLIDRADRIINMVGGKIISNVRTQESIRICSALSKNPELAEMHISPGTLTRIAEQMTIHEVDRGTTIVREGMPGDCFYLIGDGTAEATKDGRHSRSLRANDSFGEVTAVTGLVNPETVVATSDVELFVLAQHELEQVLAMDESFEEKLRLAYMERQ